MTYDRTNTDAQNKANEVLAAFRAHPDSWQYAVTIIQTSSNDFTRFFGLGLMENMVRLRWKSLPDELSAKIKAFILEAITHYSQGPETPILRKFDMLLIYILRHDFPTKWPTFIEELVEGAKTGGPSVCRNNLLLLQLLVEEVFDFSTGHIRSRAAALMKASFMANGDKVLSLIIQILRSDASLGLPLLQSLHTLTAFIKHVPHNVILSSGVFQEVVGRISLTSGMQLPMCCLDALSAFISSLPTELPPSVSSGLALETILDMHDSVLQMVLSNICPMDTDFNAIIDQDPDNVSLVNSLGRFLVAFYSHFLVHLEARMVGVKEEKQTILGLDPAIAALASSARKGSGPLDVSQLRSSPAALTIVSGLTMLSAITKVTDVDFIFHAMVDFWYSFGQSLARSAKNGVGLGGVVSSGRQNAVSIVRGNQQRIQFYDPTLCEVRRTVISNMPRPEEVIITVTDDGQAIRERLQDVDSMAQYDVMKKVLRVLSFLNLKDTISIIEGGLQAMANPQLFDYNVLRPLSWAAGALSNNLMPQQTENAFLMSTLHSLINLTDYKVTVADKAVAASCVMYVCASFSRFLNSSDNFLRTVILKLVQFMHESHEGVKEMAVDTFLTIAERCSRTLALATSDKTEFLSTLFANTATNTEKIAGNRDLLTVYFRACGLIIASIQSSQLRDQMLLSLMHTPNQEWKAIMAGTQQDIQYVLDPKVIERLNTILAVNKAVCEGLGTPFTVQLVEIFLDLIQMVVFYNKVISQKIESGSAAEAMLNANTTHIRLIRACKREILSLFTVFVEKTGDLNTLYNSLLPKLFPLLEFFNGHVEAAKESETLSLFSAVIKRLRDGLLASDSGKQLFSMIVVPSITAMQARQIGEAGDLSRAVYQMMHSVVTHCPKGLFVIPNEAFNAFLEILVRGFQGSDQTINQTAVETLYTLLTRLESRRDFLAHFYQSLYASLISAALDTLHTHISTHVAKCVHFLVSHAPSLFQGGTVPASLAQTVQSLGYQHFDQALVAEIEAEMSAPDAGIEGVVTAIGDLVIIVKEATL
ncbi:hypothetical protein KIPB_006684 [Kipferlia bialata]|uniref:Importin N-terminal domain-containing protein n=1 Tax=Kipferlia bialata TaxID=797122 RepID=A0A9K3CYX3_9EUKA|nr:hypothetical protein KIPB_006684 [Kipferlia bialata]|eukprot:g6684.t1